MVELWLKSNVSGDWVALDIGNDVAISITKSFEEVEDFTTRKSTYSKTFTIPQTLINNNFFSSTYLVNASGFAADVVVPAVVKYGGADVFNGEIRLNRIVNSLEGGYYEIFLTQSLPDFTQLIQDVKLVELDYSGLTHTLDYDTIVSTWSYSGGNYNDYAGITGKIVYPLGFYGYDSTKYYSLFDLSNSGFTNSASALAVNQFTPWVNVKYLVDSIFTRSGFNYDSSFFDSEYFKGIFTIAKTNDTQGAQIASGSSTNQNVFRASDSRAWLDLPGGNFNTNYYYGFIFRNVDNNPLAIFSPSTRTPPRNTNNVVGRGHFFTTAVSGEYKFKYGYNIKPSNGVFFTALNIAIKDVDDGTIYRQVQGIILLAGANNIMNDAYLTATIPAGRRVALFYSRQNTAGNPYADLIFYSAYWELWQSPPLSFGGDVLLQDNLPKEVSCLDFFKGIISMFNLVVVPNGEKSFLIERWSDYFSSGTTRDWSQKIDLSSEYSLSPTNILKKEYIISFANSTDRLSQVNQQNRNQQFGTYRYLSKAPFHSGTVNIEIPFQPLPISTFDNETKSNVLVPHLYTWNAGGGTDPNTYTPLGSDLRLGFYNGLMDVEFYQSPELNQIYILSGLTSVSHTTYPSISHLSAYEYFPSTFSDLNIGNQYDFWQAPNDTYQGFTVNDVWNNCWADRIDPLYADDVKILTGNFQLTPTEINNIQFNDKIYFLGAWWRLLQMSDADITDLSIVSCTFLKLPYFTSTAPLIPPTYQQSVEPTNPPGPASSPYTALTFSDSSITNMCNEVGGTLLVYSNCSVINEGCFVYSDAGATTPIVEGTLLKLSGGTTIYQVVEYGVLTNFQEC